MLQKRPTHSLIFCSGSPRNERTPAVKSDGRRRSLSDAKIKLAMEPKFVPLLASVHHHIIQPHHMRQQKTPTAAFLPLQQRRAKLPR